MRVPGAVRKTLCDDVDAVLFAARSTRDRSLNSRIVFAPSAGHAPPVGQLDALEFG